MCQRSKPLERGIGHISNLVKVHGEVSKLRLLGKAPIGQLGHLVIGEVDKLKLAIELERGVHRPELIDAMQEKKRRRS